MKSRKGFISNSSSTAFIIVNKTNMMLTIVDFVRENPQLINEFVSQYNWHKNDPRFTQECLLESAEGINMDLPPGESCCVFGDEDGTLIGQIFDYILRDGGDSESFSWRFEEYHR